MEIRPLRIDSDGMVYLLFSEGYRPGGYNSARAANSGAVPKVREMSCSNKRGGAMRVLIPRPPRLGTRRALRVCPRRAM